jgi:uncharacterized repeat protein (TIGR01451 family)
MLKTRSKSRRLSRSSRAVANRSSRRHRFAMEMLEPRAMLTGTWTPVTNLSAGGFARFALLSSGSVIVPRGATSAGTQLLTPDANGSYVNGTWSSGANFTITARSGGSVIALPDGRLMYFGGVDSTAGTPFNDGQIYDPVANTWTNMASFPESGFGNGPTELLANGQLLAGSTNDPNTYLYNLATNTWSAGPTKLYGDSSAKESWTLLADGSILSYDVNGNAGEAQRLDPTTMTWVDAGAVPVALEAGISAYQDMGPGVLLPGGKVLQFGRSSYTAIYTPPTPNDGTNGLGSWTAGPTIPNGLEAGGENDANGGSTAAILPNGHVLFCADMPDTGGPTKFFEWDPTAPLANSLTDATPPVAGYPTNSVNYATRMLLLPTGQVLLGNAGATGLTATTQLYVYTPDGAPDTGWQPIITNVVTSGNHFTLTGTQLNGVSAGASHGTSTQMATNFPIVELKDSSGHVYFARTFNWSSTGVQTGSTLETTDFTLPGYLSPGDYSLFVVANGIASDAYDFSYNPANPIADLALGGTAPATASTGNNIVYTFKVTNKGFANTTGVVVTDTLGANLQYTSASTPQGSFTQSGGVVTFSLGSLAVGQTVTVTVTAQALQVGTLQNSATVTSDVFDADTSNNTALVSVLVDQGTGIPAANTFLLHSDPGAKQVIYLDFNGNVTTGSGWNSASQPQIVTPAFDSDGNAASFSDQELTEIQRIWQRVMEDYIPFNVDVTTQDPGVAGLTKTNSKDTTWGVRVCVGGSDTDWFGSAAGGVAFVGTFATATVDTPCFVFAQTLGNNEKDLAEACSHEAGHTLGLSHDGLTNPVEEYYSGSGTGPTGWAPIMGDSYGEELSQWSKGEYAGANNTQDDLAIISASNNGFGYRADDHGNTTATAAALSGSGITFSGSGIIERNTDVDMFSFTTTGGTEGIAVNPWVRGPDLDIIAKLYNSAGTLIATSNPVDLLSAGFQMALAAGKYYLSVAGTGKGDPLNGGYSNYDSLGQYTINIGANTLPVANAGTALNGTEDVPVTFNATASSDADGNALMYEWNFGDGTSAATSTPTITHSYLYGGTFTATLTVDDGHGGTGSATTTAVITEVNDSPVASAGGPYSGRKGVALTLDGSSSSDFDNVDGSSTNNQTLTYTWNFGDGTTATGKTISHTYATAGNFAVSLTVSDGIATSTSTTTANIVAGSTSDIYVWDITTDTRKDDKLQDAQVTVVVHSDSNANGVPDSSDSVLKNANVTVQLRNSAGTIIGTASGTTNKQGIFNSTWFSSLANGVYVAEVTALSATGYTWNKLLDPTPNDTDLDGDNLPDQQFTIAAGAAKGPTSSSTDQPLSSSSSGATSAVPASIAVANNSPHLPTAAVDQAIASFTKLRSRHATNEVGPDTFEGLLDDVFAAI